MKLVIIATNLHAINACDFDLLYRNSQHEIVKVFYQKDVANLEWFKSGQPCPKHRNGFVTRLTDLPNSEWNEYSDLLDQLAKLDFDCVCLGGNCALAPWLAERLNCKFLYSNYGWLPWQECFYIDEKGTGSQSSITSMTLDKFTITENRTEELERIRETFNVGEPIPFKNFIYVPLPSQYAEGNKSSRFGSSREFLFKVKAITPAYTDVLVTEHLCGGSEPTQLLPGMIDVTNMNLNKHELYTKSKAVVTVNSANVIGGLLFGKKVFTYGKDIFSNKRMTYENIESLSTFERLLNSKDENQERIQKFLHLLLQRQVYRHRCGESDYVNSHYWCQSLK